MKKSALALSAAMSCGIACAQSSVTLFGIVDAGVSRLSSSGFGNRLGLSNGGIAASRLGFRGTEDLGGGLKAGFWLETAVSPDTGTPAVFGFTRRSTVSLSGPFGELRLGRDFTPIFLNAANFDPFGARGVGQVLSYDNFGFSTVRNSNSVGYFLPAGSAGIYGQVQYAFGEKASTVLNDKQGNFMGGRLGYQSGPVNVVAALGRWKQAIGASDTAPLALGRDLDMVNVAGSWDFGMVKPMFIYDQERVRNAPAGSNRIDSLLVGATIPIGAGEIRAAVSRYDLKDSANDFGKVALGYGYNLSKRTQLYASVARLNNKGTATRSIVLDGLAATGTRQGGTSSGFDIGVRHAF